jgi:NADH-quinone oxidoreductase subunit M
MLLPDATRQFAWIIAVLAVVNILYAASICLVQRDMKRLIAYSSVSHMGYVLLGVSALTTISLTGAALQMFTHGTITGLLFACVGLIYDKAHTRQIAELGGLARRMPVIASIFVIASLASLGLPSMSGFVAELLVFLGAWPVWWWATALGIVGVLFSAGYLLWLLQRVLFGPLRPSLAHLGDATAVEATPIVILVATIFAVGLVPSLVTSVINASLPTLMQRVGG